MACEMRVPPPPPFLVLPVPWEAARESGCPPRNRKHAHVSPFAERAKMRVPGLCVVVRGTEAGHGAGVGKVA